MVTDRVSISSILVWDGLFIFINPCIFDTECYRNVQRESYTPCRILCTLIRYAQACFDPCC